MRVGAGGGWTRRGGGPWPPAAPLPPPAPAPPPPPPPLRPRPAPRRPPRAPPPPPPPATPPPPRPYAIGGCSPKNPTPESMGQPLPGRAPLGCSRDNRVELIQARIRRAEAMYSSPVVASNLSCLLPGLATRPLRIVNQAHTVFTAVQCCRHDAGPIPPKPFGPPSPNVHELVPPPGASTQDVDHGHDARWLGDPRAHSTRTH